MLTISIPNNNIPEREYIIETLVSGFLGFQYNLIVGKDNSNNSLRFANNELVIIDSFFSQFPDPLSYLSIDAFPKKICYIKNEFTTENNIPVIYGTNDFLVSEKKIICGIDIFASSFFLLTRWEEFINLSRDKHDRFPGTDSVAFKNNFLHRSVVNEYVEMLWKMLQKLGYQGERKKRNYELVLTHDIDGLSYASFRSVVGDIMKRKNLKLALENFKFLFSNDPYDTFDFFMTNSERHGVKSHFYFMSTNSKMTYDTGYYLNRRFFRSKIKEIKRRGHLIGFHPGYYTFIDYKRWNYEKQLLEEAVQQEIVEGRQHFLRMDVTKTLPIWDKNNMNIDSTLGYPDIEGFRCGTGDIFHIFNFLERKVLKLKERPLILMDGTLRQYQNYSQDHVLDIIQKYITTGKKYNTTITILFHNSSFFGEWAGYDSIYKEILNM